MWVADFGRLHVTAIFIPSALRFGTVCNSAMAESVGWSPGAIANSSGPPLVEWLYGLHVSFLKSYKEFLGVPPKKAPSLFNVAPGHMCSYISTHLLERSHRFFTLVRWTLGNTLLWARASLHGSSRSSPTSPKPTCKRTCSPFPLTIPDSHHLTSPFLTVNMAACGCELHY